MSEAQEPRIVLRRLGLDDYQDMRKAMVEAYAGSDTDPWDAQDIERLIGVFPEGQLCIEVDGFVAAIALAIIVDYNRFGDNHTFDQITGGHTFSTHDNEIGRAHV